MRIRFKLMGSFASLAAVIALLGFYVHHTGNLIAQRLSTVKQVAVIGMVDAAAMSQAIQQIHLVVYQVLAEPITAGSGAGGPDSFQASRQELNRQLQTFQRSLERSRKAASPPPGSPASALDNALEEIQEQFETHRRMLTASLAEAETQPAQARRHFDEHAAAHLRTELLPAILAFQERAEKEFALNTRAMEQQLDANQFHTNLLSIGAVLASVVLGLWVSRSIVAPLGKLKAAALQFGKGDFQTALQINRPDELGVLGMAFNQMRDELRATMVSKDRLEESLREKEILLREVHHRVKNNLQIISSFLRLQAAEANDPSLARLLGESQDRVRAMARIHEQLHQSDDLAKIDIAAYVQELCENLTRSHAADGCELSLAVQADPAWLPLNVAIPCGLILNELVSNSLKHAVAESAARREVTVVYAAGPQRHTLGVRDNGRSASAADFHGGRSLGLKLVHALAKQLHGELNITTDGGTSIMVDYPVGEDRVRG